MSYKKIRIMTTYTYITIGSLIQYSINPDKDSDKTGFFIGDKTEKDKLWKVVLQLLMVLNIYLSHNQPDSSPTKYVHEGSYYFSKIVLISKTWKQLKRPSTGK